MSTIIGLDIGGTNLRIGLVRDGQLVRGETQPTHEALTDGDELALLGSLIKAFRGDAEVDAVSIGFPSSIGADDKTVLNPPNIVKKDGSRAFSGKNVVDPLHEMLGVKVLVNKDANLLLHFDAYQAGAEGVLVGCYIGTGFGSAAMIDGRLVKGRHSSAMEAGHIPFFRSDRLCGCGKVGCAECHASGLAAKEMLETFYPGQTFAQVFRNHVEDQPVADLIEAIAVTVAALVNLFDPHMLFLGGGVLSEEFPKELLAAAVLRHTLAPYPRADLEMRFCRHDAYAGVIGAALCAEKAVFRA